jgi:N-acetylneuraminic acid mutarotase
VPLSSVHAFDTNRPANGWFELPPIPGMGRQSVAAAAIGPKLYVFGGAYYKTWISGSHLVFNGDAYVLDLDTVQWKQLPDVPVPAWGMAAVPFGDRSILLFGGDTSGSVEQPYQYAEKWKGVARPNSEVFVFDTKLQTYRVLPTPLPLIQMTDEYRRELELRRQKGEKNNLKVYNYDYSRGIRRNNTKVSVIGDRLYVLGGVTGVGERTAHAVGELLIGTIRR